MDRIEEQARSAFTYPAGGETGGLLLGSKAVLPDGPAIIIETAELIQCEHSAGKEFTLSEKDREALSTQMDRLRAEGVVVVGLYRSHARSEEQITLLPKDRELLERLLPGVATVFLLVRPLAGSPTLADIFFWHEGRVARESAFVPFPFSDAAQHAAAREPVEMSIRPLRVDFDPPPQEVRALNRSYSRSRPGKWPIMFVFGVLGAAAGYGVFYHFSLAPQVPVSLEIEAHRSAHAWIFRWNPAIAGQSGATTGTSPSAMATAQPDTRSTVRNCARASSPTLLQPRTYASTSGPWRAMAPLHRSP